MSRARIAVLASAVLTAGALPLLLHASPPEEARSANGVVIPVSARSAAFTVW